MDARCPECGEHAVPGGNYDPKLLNIPDDYQKIKDGSEGTMEVYVCLHPDCNLYFITKSD